MDACGCIRRLIYSLLRLYSSCQTTLSKLFLSTLKSRVYVPYFPGFVLPQTNKEHPRAVYPVMGRSTINSTISQFSAKINVPEQLWEVKGGRAKGKSVESERINRHPGKVYSEQTDIYARLLFSGIFPGLPVCDVFRMKRVPVSGRLFRIIPDGPGFSSASFEFVRFLFFGKIVILSPEMYT